MGNAQLRSKIEHGGAKGVFNPKTNTWGWIKITHPSGASEFVKKTTKPEIPEPELVEKQEYVK